MISVIILSYRSPALLRLCLKSLAQSTADLTGLEVIVVDNASTIETRNVVTQEYARVFPAIKLVPLSDNTGYTRGVNEGLRAATGEYLIALNYDIVVQPGAIEQMADYLRQHPQVGLIGPKLLNFDDTHQSSYFRFYRPLTILSRRIPWLPGARKESDRFTMRTSNPEMIQQVDCILGAAFMTSRQALEHVGYLDEKLFHYFSDVDWAWRFWENGYSVVYDPLAAMYHYYGRTSRGRFGIFDVFLNQATRWHIRDAITYFSKHGVRGQRPTHHTHEATLSLR